MSLSCDRCFIGVAFMGAFKLAPESDFDFCKDCWLALMGNAKELDHFKGSDTRSSDLGEFVRVAVATGRFINKGVNL